MQNLTTTEFIKAAKMAGIDASALPHKAGEPRGVNVWVNARVAPTTTVWWPRPGHPSDQITWGPNYDWSAHRDITAKGLVDRVIETTEERPAQPEGSPPKG